MPIPEAIARNKESYRFIPGQGYVNIGPPPMPADPIGVADDCKPPSVAVSSSYHLLQPPMGAEKMKMQWSEGSWVPPLGAGKRMAFTPAYLAAHGWTYVSGA